MGRPVRAVALGRGRRAPGHESAASASATAAILPPVTKVGSIQGELQAQIMAALWRLEAGTVEDVRQALPARYRGAYNTAQTVLNRLADRGLLDRERDGHAFTYRPRFSEAEYLSRSIASTLATASSAARQAALAQVIGSLDGDELEELRRLAKQLQTGKPQKP